MHTKFRRYRRTYQMHKRRHIRRFKLWSRHPFMVPAVTLLVLIGGTVGSLYALNRHSVPRPDAFIVIISHDHVTQTVPSQQRTVGSLLSKLGIILNQGDVVEPSLTTQIEQDDFRINIYRAVPVEIVDGTQHTYTFSAATTARSIANQAGKQLYPEDEVSVNPTANFITQGAIGEQVVVARSTPVNLNLYGTPVTTRTLATTVQGLLKEKHVRLVQQDTVSPGLDTPIIAGENIAIVRNGTRTITVNQDIPMPTQVIQDSSLAFGTSAVRQQGSAGKEIVVYRVNLQNNTEVSRTPIQTTVIQQPVTQIVVQGTNLSGIKGDMALAGIDASDYTYADYIISHESGWCPTKWQGEVGYCPTGFVPLHSINSSYGYGLGQSTPASNMAAFGSDWETNPITQLKWANAYAHSHYGSWYRAYTHKINTGWW